MSSKFVYVTYIRTTPEKLWAALTKPEFTKQFFSATRKAPALKWMQVFNAGVDHPVFATVLVAGVVGISIMFQGIQSVALPMSTEFGYTKEIEDRVLAPMPVWLVALGKVFAAKLRQHKGAENGPDLDLRPTPKRGTCVPWRRTPSASDSTPSFVRITTSASGKAIPVRVRPTRG